MIIVRSRAPVRIDFAGGWTDVALFAQEQPGAVVNSAINIYSYATIKKLPEQQTETKEYGYRHVKTVSNLSVRIYSADFNIYQRADSVKQLEYDGNIDLVKAALKKSNIDGGIEVITRSDAPAGSGLGTSAAIGVALIAGLMKFMGKILLPYEYPEMASSIERHELNILGGKQDHYASGFGGFNFMEFSGEQVTVSKLQLPRETIYELEKSLILCYTGQSRLSSNIHQNVVDAYFGKDKDTIDALNKLKQIAVEMKDVLLKGNLCAFGQLLNHNWENQKRLHPSVTNSQIDSLFEVALANGAVGGKACGAGGGGCLLFYCEPDKEHIIREVLEQSGVEIINFNFDCTGLQTWIA